MSERKWVYHYDDTDEWVSSSDPNDHAMYLLQDITVQLNRREERVAALEAAQQSWEEERARLIAERDAWAERYTARSQDLEAERDALRLRLEKVERLGEALAKAAVMYRNWRSLPEADAADDATDTALQAWRNRDAEVQG